MDTRFWKDSSVLAMACVFLFATLALSSSQPVYAQSVLHWSDPVALQMLNPEYRPAFPDIAADPYGRLHVVVAANAYWASPDRYTGTILYTQGDRLGWEKPIDILASPNGTVAGVERLAASRDGQLHLLWSELQGGLYWSQAHSLDALSVRAWTTIRVAPQGTGGDLVVDDEGNVAIAFVENSRNVIFQRTFDVGQTWPIVETIWAPLSYSEACRDLRMAIDKAGVYHVVWSVASVSGTAVWQPFGVRYARSTDGGRTWIDHHFIQDEGSYPNIGFDADGNVHWLWNHSVGTTDGRYHAWSQDGGKTWSEPQWIFPGLSGQTGWPRLILDSSGQLHQLTSGYGLGREGGIYHSLWSKDHWTNPLLISRDIKKENNEGPTVALVGGNELYVCWRNTSPSRDIFCAWLDTPTPRWTPEPVPTREPIVSKTKQALPTNSPAPAHSSTMTPLARYDTTTEVALSQSVPLLMGLAPSVILVSALVIWHSKRRQAG